MDDIKILSIPYPHNLQRRCDGIFYNIDEKENFRITKECMAKANVCVIDALTHNSYCFRCTLLMYPDKEKELAIYDNKA